MIALREYNSCFHSFSPLCIGLLATSKLSHAQRSNLRHSTVTWLRVTSYRGHLHNLTRTFTDHTQLSAHYPFFFLVTEGGENAHPHTRQLEWSGYVDLPWCHHRSIKISLRTILSWRETRNLSWPLDVEYTLTQAYFICYKSIDIDQLRKLRNERKQRCVT